MVDPASRDETEHIARARADLVQVRAFDDFASQRNAALALATGDWIFAVDADERSSPAQAEEVRRLIRTGESPHVGFRVPIRSEILGRPFRFSGTQLDRPLRLFRRDSGRWVGAVHETVAIAGEIGQLSVPLTHRTIPDMRTFLEKINEYTSLAAIEDARAGRSAGFLDLAARPIWAFAKLYLGRQGFRDGPEGLVFCGLSGVSVAVRYWKLRELTRGGRAA